MSVTVVDGNFILPLVNGSGEIIEQLDPNIRYELIFKEAYYLVLQDGESEYKIPKFIELKN
ncbi:hypothetical protein [Carnobacterium maltaromaticum]|uniref:hypothetical protein n=1 Tax=Carnobacterium maltaromaticum TaxID=2751 RepID=UPI0007056040|nr:hypothetical protein [Carnobacterium maltaromaticum]AOA04046.1 hypothetical protein BFC23_17000 [Carnobacterium maltaromaticum]KRN87243.1 hypothetical protein IV75_GL000298 [Carnobacterium maltaromaticum]MBC9810399.1 hypothetical protein [Carnobacterium maltaromaticum]GED49945.1 hypothetical protein CMA01_23550 [Carnobacterium maltaromaticum]